MAGNYKTVLACLTELDIGVGSTWREPGLKDQGSIMTTLDYMINKYRETASLESYSDKVLAKKLLSTLDELKSPQPSLTLKFTD